MVAKHNVTIALALLAAFLCQAAPAIAQVPKQDQPAPLKARSGWVVMATPHPFAKLVERLEAAVKTNKMGLVNAASASDGAKAQGFTIPGNRVVGVFRNDFARRMLAASIPAGIEAPIRFYITENAGGTATLSYRTPNAVFAPYMKGAGSDLRKVAAELNVIFATIASEAAKP
jgi:uncharacterized protein (DUF302 family)